MNMSVSTHIRRRLDRLPARVTRLLESTIARHATGSLGLTLVNTALGFVLSVVTARLLGLEEFGILLYCLAWIELLKVVSRLGLDRLLLREVAFYVATEQWGLIRGILRWGNLTALLLSVTLAAVSWSLIRMGWGESSPRLVAAYGIFAVSLPVLVLNDLRQAALRGLHHVVLGQAPDRLLRPALQLGAFAVGSVVLSRSLSSFDGALIYGFASLASLIVGTAILRRKLPPVVNAARIESAGKRWLGGALPILLITGMQIFSARIDILMLGALASTNAASVYGVAMRSAMVVTFPLLALNAALAPQIARLFANGDDLGLERLMVRGSRAALLGTLPIVLIILIFREPLLGIFGDDFVIGKDTLVLLVLGEFVHVAAGSAGLLPLMTGFERRLILPLVATAILNLVLNAVLIPVLGLEGAASATTISKIFLSIGYLAIVYKQFGFLVNPVRVRRSVGVPTR